MTAETDHYGAPEGAKQVALRMRNRELINDKPQHDSQPR